MRSLKPAIAAFTLTLTILSPVIRGEPPEAKPDLIGHVRVEWKGLDLRSEADARTLLTRIEKAAYRACGGNPKLTRNYDVMPSRTVKTYQLCREDATKRAIDQIGAAQLTRVYEAERQTTVADRPARLPTPHF